MRALIFALVVVSFGVYSFFDSRRPVSARSELKAVTGTIGSVEIRREGLRRKGDVPYLFLVRDSKSYRMYAFDAAVNAWKRLRQGAQVTLLIDSDSSRKPHVWSLTANGTQLLNYDTVAAHVAARQTENKVFSYWFVGGGGFVGLIGLFSLFGKRKR